MQRTWNKSTSIKLSKVKSCLNIKKSLVVVFFISLFLYSCATVNIDVIQAGPFFPSHKNEIKLYTDKNQVEKPFGAIAILHSDRFDCSQKLQKKIIENAKKQARKIGADGIIYYFDFGEKNPYLELNEKCFFSGLAIKFVDVKKD
jgi:hypothetical protein